MVRVKRIATILLALTLLLVLSSVSACAIFSKPRPEGERGALAEALADRVLESVNAEAWAKTGAVTWRFPRGHHHLWDRSRGFASVTWSAGSKRALVRLSDKRGVAFIDGERVEDEERARDMVERAWSMWANDSFWLNPIVKIRDEGTSRALVRLEEPGVEGLLVTYGQGGDTPGDAYLWIVDSKTGRPRAWRMWVSIIPVGGLQFAWEDWITLSTGALVAAGHDGLFDVPLTHIEGAATLAELQPGEEDPFVPLLKLP